MSTQFEFHWQLNWKILLFSAVLLPVTLKLGFWQLERAEEKQQILSVYNARRQSEPVNFGQLNEIANLQYMKVQVDAEVSDYPTLLLDNRIRNGVPGYEILSVVKTVRGFLLVNRGWVASGLDRQVKPVIPALESGVLKGYLYKIPGRQLMLGEDNWQPDKPLVVIQNGAPDRVAQRLGVNIFPYVLRLDQQETNFNADWPVINVQPAKHTGYAVQWFALATALVVLTLFASSNLSDRFRAKASVNEKTGIKK